MQINTKYDIGQKVFVIHDSGEILSGVVRQISSTHLGEPVYTMYSIWYDRQGGASYYESELFESRAAAEKAMEKTT